MSESTPIVWKAVVAPLHLRIMLIRRTFNPMGESCDQIIIFVDRYIDPLAGVFENAHLYLMLVAKI
jgi:hypothetical protein